MVYCSGHCCASGLCPSSDILEEHIVLGTSYSFQPWSEKVGWCLPVGSVGASLSSWTSLPKVHGPQISGLCSASFCYKKQVHQYLRIFKNAMRAQTVRGNCKFNNFYNSE
jgi:hypothetical protein